MNRDIYLIYEIYRKQFNDSTSDVQDLLRVIYYNLQEPGDTMPPNPISSDNYERWEEAMKAIKAAIYDAAMHGVDLTDVEYGLRHLEKQKYFNPEDADKIIDIINVIERDNWEYLN